MRRGRPRLAHILGTFVIFIIKGVGVVWGGGMVWPSPPL